MDPHLPQPRYLNSVNFLLWGYDWPFTILAKCTKVELASANKKTLYEPLVNLSFDIARSEESTC